MTRHCSFVLSILALSIAGCVLAVQVTSFLLFSLSLSIFLSLACHFVDVTSFLRFEEARRVGVSIVRGISSHAIGNSDVDDSSRHFPSHRSLLDRKTNRAPTNRRNRYASVVERPAFREIVTDQRNVNSTKKSFANTWNATIVVASAGKATGKN